MSAAVPQPAALQPQQSYTTHWWLCSFLIDLSTHQDGQLTVESRRWRRRRRRVCVPVGWCEWLLHGVFPGGVLWLSGGYLLWPWHTLQLQHGGNTLCIADRTSAQPQGALTINLANSTPELVLETPKKRTEADPGDQPWAWFLLKVPTSSAVQQLKLGLSGPDVCFKTCIRASHLSVHNKLSQAIAYLIFAGALLLNCLRLQHTWLMFTQRQPALSLIPIVWP